MDRQWILMVPKAVWLNAKEAREWLGLGETEFERECERYPDILAPDRRHKEHKWHCLDLAYYAYVAARLHAKSAAEQQQEKKS